MKLEDQYVDMMTNSSDAEIALALADGLSICKDADTMYRFLEVTVGAIRRSEQLRLKNCS